jgi:hypothetical protein
MRTLFLRAGALLLFPILSLGFICLPFLPDPPNPYTGTPPLGSFGPVVNAAVVPTTPGAPGMITLDIDIPSGGASYPASAKPLLPAGVQVLLPAQWGAATDAAIIDGSAVGSLTGTFTATNDFTGDPTCQTTADFTTPLQDATTNTASPSYPAWLKVLAPGAHRARYAGSALVENTDDVPVNILVDQYADGRKKIAVIVGDPYVLPDFLLESMCAPWSFTLTLNGTTGGANLYTNPAAAGTYTIRAILTSEWDEDNDGWGNQLDNCPLIDNPAQTDADLDFLGAGCDNNDSVPVVDKDIDTISNGYDNCPFAANATQADSDLDNIGDACDPNTSEASRFVLDCSQDVFVGVSGSDTAGCTNLAAPVVTPTPTSTPTPPPPSSVGGVANQPDVTALPSNSPSPGRNYMLYVIGAATTALIVVAFGAVAWHRRAS